MTDLTILEADAIIQSHLADPRDAYSIDVSIWNRGGRRETEYTVFISPKNDTHSSYEGKTLRAAVEKFVDARTETTPTLLELSAQLAEVPETRAMISHAEHVLFTAALRR